MESQSSPVVNYRKKAMMMAMIVVILGASFTAWCVDASFEKGRLSSLPNYDDVVYFLSATTILEAFNRSGFNGVAKVIYLNFHSPYSTLLAAAAFAMLGYHDSSPYIFNFLVVLLYLSFLSYTLRDLPFLMRLAMMVFFLSLPFATMAVVEFRPDLCWATLIGFCAVFGVSRRNYFRDWRQPAIHAVLFSFALLAKPSTFAMTIIVFGLSACCRVAMEWLDHRSLSWQGIARTALVYLIVTCMIAGPYFVFFASQTWEYFWKNLFGANKAIWTYQADWLQHFGYYLSGHSLASNLGKGVWIIGCFWLFGTIAAVARRDNVGIRLAGGLWIIVISIYLLSSLAQMKSPFLGGAFYSTLIFGAACLLNEMSKGILPFRVQSRFIFTSLSILLAVSGVMLYQWPAYSGVMNSETGRNYKHIGEMAVNEISGLPLPKNPLIVFTHSGPVGMGNVVMWFLQQGLPIRFENMSCRRNIKDFEQAIQDADLVFLQDKGMMGANLRFPSESFQERFRSIVSGDQRFDLLRKIETLDGKNVYLYINKCIEKPMAKEEHSNERN